MLKGKRSLYFIRSKKTSNNLRQYLLEYKPEKCSLFERRRTDGYIPSLIRCSEITEIYTPITHKQRDLIQKSLDKLEIY